MSMKNLNDWLGCEDWFESFMTLSAVVLITLTAIFLALGVLGFAVITLKMIAESIR